MNNKNKNKINKIKYNKKNIYIKTKRNLNQNKP